MENLNENYLKGLIKATLILFNDNESMAGEPTIQDEVIESLKWSFAYTEGKKLCKVECAYLINQCEELVSIGTYERPATFKERDDTNTYWFTILESESENKFIGYLTDFFKEYLTIITID